jgi:hypothetical protein
MGTHSNVVTEGMKRVCSAFTRIVQPLAFKRGTGRKWARQLDGFEETIFISRSGATYGAPCSPSISLQLDLVSSRVSDQERVDLNHHIIQLTRRPTGYCYHHRFNAETGSTYDRCLEELGLFIVEVAEPWFAGQRSARKEQ